ncbi:serine hydrolase domain-containing protein [Kribbella sp. CA-293567]|uniref:serine hydrolase domain-containing protein n=1 Tax=Kribbella sp. CA-293567 TaxID=3002436 RepID=UPI0022DE6694|nr:serine hydrolase domain-containing protein [Kribbella sp. CA-293567]WBQ04036.1 serine hydrolase [Kribbella sp. CA-293567]
MTIVGKGFRGTAILLAVGLSVTLAGVGLSGAAASISAEVETHPRGAAGGPSATLVDAVRRTVAAGVPGAVVRVDRGRGGVTELASQAEWTKVDHRLKPGDQLRVGSNTKTMVAVLVLQLVGEHRLALDQPVEKWLPGMIPNGGRISLRMLLNHTSGLANNTDDEQVLRSVFGLEKRSWTAAELLAAGTSQPPVAAPGEKWFYSNTNYVALGLVLERVTGRDLSSLLNERIIQPLHLNRTYLASSAVPRKRDTLAPGYEPDAAHLGAVIPGLPPGFHFVGNEHDGHVDVSTIDPSWAGAAGGIVSTTRDWSRFLTALMSGRLLPPAQLRQMLTMIPADPERPTAGSYGLGLAKIPTPCGPVYGHTGGIPGYRSDIFTDRTGTRSAAVIVTEQQGLGVPAHAAAHHALVEQAACAMYGRPVPTR